MGVCDADGCLFGRWQRPSLSLPRISLGQMHRLGPEHAAGRHKTDVDRQIAMRRDICCMPQLPPDRMQCGGVVLSRKEGAVGMILTRSAECLYR